VLDHHAIRRLIPHHGEMCLLDEVRDWTATSIICTAVSHRAPGNPLRRSNALSATSGVEYGLQAAAVHGALIDSTPQPPGFLTGLRRVTLHRARLDDGPARLDVTAELIARQARGFLYSFEVAFEGTKVLSGEATIMLMRKLPRS
jgi:predicted hotdog family 3-hydroxylacyl-ACP dehydratase